MSENLKSEEIQITDIVAKCDKLLGQETLVVQGFGRNRDLVLYIEKDTEYNPNRDVDENNLVSITTKQGGIAVDDAVGIYVTDGELDAELARIYNYKDFEIL